MLSGDSRKQQVRAQEGIMNKHRTGAALLSVALTIGVLLALPGFSLASDPVPTPGSNPPEIPPNTESSDPQPASAPPVVVKTVPWYAPKPVVPHDTWSGRTVTLKGTADVEGAGVTFSWDPGDGSSPVTGTVDGIITNRFAIEAQHVYTGGPGDVFIATLTVTDTGTGGSGQEDYHVQIQEKDLGVEVNVAIDKGLWYLHKTLRRTTESGIDFGDWTGGGYASSGYHSVTASNILAFEVNGHLESGDPSNPYVETVQRALRRVFNNYLATATLSVQTNGLGSFNPDSNGNGIGVRTSQGYQLYQGGMFMDAIVATGPASRCNLGSLICELDPAVECTTDDDCPQAVATSCDTGSGICELDPPVGCTTDDDCPPFATTGPSGIVDRGYRGIIQDMVDYYAHCQYDYYPAGGGWRYSCNEWPDNSACQWAAIGIIPAERDFGAEVPQIVKDWNEVWLNYSQRGDGACGYTSSGYFPWGPYATTPSCMVQMAMDGIGRGSDPIGSPTMWDLSETYLRNGFGNVLNYYYGLFSLTKAMLLHDSNGDGTPEPLDLLQSRTGAPPLNWYGAEASDGDPMDGVARTLVGDQSGAGYWRGHNRSSSQYPFETGWAIVMLRRTITTLFPKAILFAVPDPAGVDQIITLDCSDSHHLDPDREIVEWDWDLDGDGTCTITVIPEDECDSYDIVSVDECASNLDCPANTCNLVEGTCGLSPEVECADDADCPANTCNYYDDASGYQTTTSYSSVDCPDPATNPCEFPVSCRVTDAGDPVTCEEVRTDDAEIKVMISVPPLRPTAEADGPYLFCPQTTPWFLDGTGSSNPDDGAHEVGQPGDFLKDYCWDLDLDLNCDFFVAQPDVTSYFMAKDPGDYLISLKVCDNSALSFPEQTSGEDLCDSDPAFVYVREATDPDCVGCDILITASAPPGVLEVQLSWTDPNGGVGYHLYRSTVSGGPFFNDTATTETSYLDTDVEDRVTYYYIVWETFLNGDEFCRSTNEDHATPVLCKPDPSPNTQGYWHRQCLGAGLITPGRNGRGPQTVLEPDFLKTLEPAVNARLQASIFLPPTFLTCEDGMDAVPPSDPCERALKQYTALLLNIESDRVQEGCNLDPVVVGCAGTYIGDLVPELAAYINSGDSDFCKLAAACAGTVNENEGIILSLLSLPFAPTDSAGSRVSLPVGVQEPTEPPSTDPTRPASGQTIYPAEPPAADTPSPEPATVSPEVTAVIEPTEAPIYGLLPAIIPRTPEGSGILAAEDDDGREESLVVTPDPKVAIEHHLAVLADPSARAEDRQVSEDALLKALSGGYGPDVRLQIVRALVAKLDVAYHSLLAKHLEGIRMEAKEFGKEKLAKEAALLLKRLEPSELESSQEVSTE
jgi:hypothetical protein